jgi:hypothetical protein
MVEEPNPVIVLMISDLNAAIKNNISYNMEF